MKLYYKWRHSYFRVFMSISRKWYSVLRWINGFHCIFTKSETLPFLNELRGRIPRHQSKLTTQSSPSDGLTSKLMSTRPTHNLRNNGLDTTINVQRMCRRRDCTLRSNCQQRRQKAPLDPEKVEHIIVRDSKDHIHMIELSLPPTPRSWRWSFDPAFPIHFGSMGWSSTPYCSFSMIGQGKC